MNVQDWCTEHYSIFTDVSTAIFKVENMLTAANREAVARQSLTAPEVRGAFHAIGNAAAECRDTVDRALALPPIPDSATEVQFRDAMSLRRRWAVAMEEAARDISADALDRATAIGVEATKQGAKIAEELRRAWPNNQEA